MSEFLIKEVYGEEALRYKKLCTKLFRAANKELENEEEYKKKLVLEDKERDKDFVRLCAFYDGILYAGIEMIPYDVNINGNVCKMYGIGGVISDPECPEKGAVKLLFKKGFEIMREKGVYISHLYPFEENYYRQYGYEVACENATWTIPVTAIPIFKKGEIKHFDNSEKMKAEIKKLYEIFSKNRNMSVVRSEKQWEAFFESHKSYVSNYFSYLHYTDGVADGFMSFSTKTYPDKPMDLVTDKLWFSSYSGLKGVMSYFPTQKSYAGNAVITLPADVDLGAIIDSCGGWGKRNSSKVSTDNGTSKAIDVEMLLKNTKYIGKGKVTIETEDKYCPWNNDCFTVEFGEEVVVKRGGKADIKMDINAFTSAILGRYDFENCTIFDNVEIFGNEEDLKKVFYKKSCFIEEHF